MNLSLFLTAPILLAAPQDRLPALDPLDRVPVETESAQSETDFRTVTRLYAVTDLVIPGSPVPDLLGGLGPEVAEAPLDGTSAYRRAQSNAEDQERWSRNMESLVAALNDHSGKKGYLARSVGLDRVEVRATVEGHAWTEEMLAVQRSAALSLYQVNVRILRLPPGTLQTLLPTPKPSCVFPTPLELQTFLSKVRTLEHDNLSAPSLSVFPRQLATVTTLGQVAYVKSYKLEIVEPGNQVIADPEVATLSEGFEIEMRVTPLPEDRAGISMETVMTHVQRPIPTKEIHLSPSVPPVTISVPEVTEVKVGGLIDLARGASIGLFASTPEGDGEIAVLVQVLVVDASDFHEATDAAPAQHPGQGTRRR